MSYVKNVTAHYRQLLDEILEERLAPRLARPLSLHLHTRPRQTFNRQSAPTISPPAARLTLARSTLRLTSACRSVLSPRGGRVV